jgi:hypothetical protein
MRGVTAGTDARPRLPTDERPARTDRAALRVRIAALLADPRLAERVRPAPPARLDPEGVDLGRVDRVAV